MDVFVVMNPGEVQHFAFLCNKFLELPKRTSLATKEMTPSVGCSNVFKEYRICSNFRSIFFFPESLKFRLRPAYLFFNFIFVLQIWSGKFSF